MLRVWTGPFAKPMVPAIALALLLNGCATPPGGTGVNSFTQAGRVGPDDGSDSCHAQAVALDNTGNFFGQDILTGAAAGAVGGGLIGALSSGDWKGALIGAAAGGAVGAAGGYWAALQQQSQDAATLNATVTNNLTTENTQINDTQIAFNNDMDCRFQQAQSIRAQYAAGSITEAQATTQMTAVKTLAQRDLALAQTINGQIQSRGAQFDTAVTNLNNGQAAPGATGAEAMNTPASIREATPIYLRPDDSSPVVGQVTRHQAVTLNATSNGYALVQTDDGTQGFAPSSAIGEPGSTRSLHVPESQPIATSGTPVQQLDGSNAASRDAFAQSVSVSQSAVNSGFQLAS
jgi:hypothetical protein